MLRVRSLPGFTGSVVSIWSGVASITSSPLWYFEVPPPARVLIRRSEFREPVPEIASVVTQARNK